MANKFIDFSCFKNIAPWSSAGQLIFLDAAAYFKPIPLNCCYRQIF